MRTDMKTYRKAHEDRHMAISTEAEQCEWLPLEQVTRIVEQMCPNNHYARGVKLQYNPQRVRNYPIESQLY